MKNITKVSVRPVLAAVVMKNILNKEVFMETASKEVI
jgi:hypothetical protein